MSSLMLVPLCIILSRVAEAEGGSTTRKAEKAGRRGERRLALGWAGRVAGSRAAAEVQRAVLDS